MKKGKYLFFIYYVLLFLFFINIVEAKKVVESNFVSDDGIVLAGLVKTDDGLISYGSYAYYRSENPEPDDLSFLGGIIAKYDNNGDFIWDYKVGNSFTMFNSVKEDSDGNYIGVGGYSDPSYAMIVKLDKNGNELWKKIYSGGEVIKNSAFYDVEVVGNEYIVTGYMQQPTSDSSPSFVYISKLSKDGEILWEINSLKLASGRGDLHQILPLDNGNFIAIGEYYDDTGNTDSCGVFIEFDINGEIIGEHSFCEEGKTVEVLDIIKSNDNYLTIIELDSYSYIYLFDKDFNVVKNVSLGNSSISGFEEYNNGYIISGNSTFTNDDGSGQLGTIAYLDSDFNLVDSETYNVNVVNAFGRFMIDGNSIYVPRFNGPDSLCILVCVSEFNSEIIKYDILYEIEEKETTNGSYVVEQNGELGKIVITPDSGYVLDTIKIIDAGGNNREYYEEDGNYYFELEDGLIISVSYKELPKTMEDVKNPVTSIFIPLAIYIGLSAIVVFIISMIKLKKQKNYLS